MKLESSYFNKIRVGSRKPKESKPARRISKARIAPPMTDRTSQSIAERVALATPAPLGRHLAGLSDRAVAWLFITPTIVLLLAINIFPLIWTVYLSFTNYRANRPGREIKWVGTRNLSSRDRSPPLASG